ncbi:ferredoxin reductase family protein [Jatrophihabitans sp.]|uniref:ferredoxin reductase family protein n=1 Tax=Jatrophihabitans sp. TaxID=1932789 RepID=UPI0030C6AAEF|nr:putative ferric reductase [Jatrophihabitans sp.]
MSTTLLSPPSHAARAPKPLRMSPQLALAVIAVGAIGVVGLWWQDTLFIYGWGSWLTNAGRVTGLLAGYAIAVLLALMARVPALERGVGSDRLARWHAMGGRYVVSLAVAHTLLIIWGYAVSAHAGLVPQTWSLLTTYPDVLMATVSLGVLVAVGVTSARAARRRLRYETWHFIHLYTYLAVALMFSHQFSTGADFTSMRNRVLWSAMYIGVGATLLWYRLIVPLLNLPRHLLRVQAVVPEGPNTVSVYLQGRNLSRLRAESGQFFRWRFLTRELWYAANPYSLSSAPQPNQLRITVKTAGEHSQALNHLTPGTRVLAEGPYGSFTAAARRRRRVLLIGAGVGITPLRSLFESIPAAPGDLTLLYRARSARDLVLHRELDAIGQARGARVHYLLSTHLPRGHDPLSRSALEQLVPDLAAHDVYLCGPDGLVEALRRELRAAGVPRRHIHHESFTF